MHATVQSITLKVGPILFYPVSLWFFYVSGDVYRERGDFGGCKVPIEDNALYMWWYPFSVLCNLQAPLRIIKIDHFAIVFGDGVPRIRAKLDPDDAAGRDIVDACSA